MPPALAIYAAGMSYNGALTAPGSGPWRSGEVDGFVPFPDEALEGSIAKRFFEVAIRHGDRTALSSPAGSWTYTELVESVGIRAAGMARRVAGTGESIAIMVRHDGPLVVCMLAVITTGHVVVVMDPTMPRHQQIHVLRESGTRLLVHDSSHATQALELVADVPGVQVALVEELEAPAIEPVAVGPTAPLMLAFTSGTSGEPKAAIITHAVVLNVARGATNALGISPDDRMPMLFPTSLAVAAYPLFLPLLNGGTLATLDVRSVGLEPIPDFLAEERITLAYMAPTVIRFLVDVLKDREFPDMRLVALGGELVDPEVMALTASMFSPEMVAVGYGTTESGVVSLHVQRADESVEGTTPCGHGVPEVEILILDGTGSPVASGESGEIAIVSPHMFHGYKDHPELNRQVLSADPQGRPGWRLYRTGDFGRIDAAGELCVSGRIDTKVKVRGRMVVLGDVEADLYGLDGVQSAAVTTRIRGGITELVAYVVPAENLVLDTASVRSELLEKREAFRVPSRVVVIDELPSLPNGKVDRRALPDPDSVLAAGQQDSDGAVVGSADRLHGRDRLRHRIRDIWELLLPVGSVGLDEDFMALGGDSLLAAQMLVMVEQQIDVTVPMGELLHARTVRELAEVVGRIQEQRPSGRSTVAKVQDGDPERPRLWFVPDLQGSAYRVRHLAAELGADQPVWSFESPLLAGIPNPYRSLDDLAERLLADLREVQPEGPYWLAGYSFGGICAYEMARQALREGHEVAFVGVVDVGPGYRGPGWQNRSPFRPWFGVVKPPPDGSGLVGSLQYYVRMVRTSPKGALRHLMVRSGLASRIDPLRFEVDLRRHGRVRPEWRLWYAWEQHWKLAATAWDRAKRYRGRVDLFWADESPSADSTMGWGDLVDDLHIHRFNGEHFGILEERGAAGLAKVLRPQIDR